MIVFDFPMKSRDLPSDSTVYIASLAMFVISTART
jgi:hypothetical protein